jgi:hypothetical protein
MPILGIFFTPVLNEQATVTIPYSRIRFLDTVHLAVRRVALTTLVWLPFLAGLLVVLVGLTFQKREQDLGFQVYVLGLLALLGSVFTLYFNCWRYVSREELLFEQSNGELALLAFRIRSRKLRRDFLSRVAAIRRQPDRLEPAAGRSSIRQPDRLEPAAGQSSIPPGTRQAVPFGVLVGYVGTLFFLLPLLPMMGWPGFNAELPSSWWLNWLEDSSPRWSAIVLFAVNQLFDLAPVLLLALMLWHSNEAARWATVALLGFHSFLAVLWPVLAREVLPVIRGPDPRRLPWLDLSVPSLIAAGLYLVLALALAAHGVRLGNACPEATSQRASGRVGPPIQENGA